MWGYALIWLLCGLHCASLYSLFFAVFLFYLLCCTLVVNKDEYKPIYRDVNKAIGYKAKAKAKALTHKAKNKAKASPHKAVARLRT